MASASAASASISWLQYLAQFQPPGTAPPQPEDRPVEVGRVREVRDPGHAARPDHRRGAVAAGRDHGRLRQRLDLGLDADRREVLLDRLRDARVGIGVHGVELGLEAVRITGLGEQVLGFLGVVRITLVVRRRTRHRRRQRLAGRRAAAIDDAHHPLLVDRHVHRLAHQLVVERRLRGVHGDVAGVQEIALDDQALIRRVVLLLRGSWRTGSGRPARRPRRASAGGAPPAAPGRPRR